MRKRERTLLDEVAEKLQVASELVATILEGREDEEENGVVFDLRMLYAGLSGMLDDVEEITYEL